ncbi:MAG: thioredoxin family protein [bacterium]
MKHTLNHRLIRLLSFPLIVIGLLAGCSSNGINTPLRTQEDAQVSPTQEIIPENQETRIATSITTVKPEPTKELIPDSPAGKAFAQRFLPYTAENLAKATSGNGKAILYFYASWCPVCKATREALKTNFDALPSTVTILVADYDKETELKKKYAINVHHTFVQVDSKGTEVGKWVGAGKPVEEIAEHLK